RAIFHSLPSQTQRRSRSDPNATSPTLSHPCADGSRQISPEACKDVHAASRATPPQTIQHPCDAVRLTVFLAVSDAGGFRAAANWLGLSPSTVSEKIVQLETQLGVPLLIRTTRSVMLTEAGRGLAHRLTPLMVETRAALQTRPVHNGLCAGS
ncbi:LysR family transcriptional regulator, partial [Lichenifustis flavocetrariae]